MTLLQIVWNGGEFIHNMLGTYDMANIAAGLIFAFGGGLLSALGKVLMTGENKDPSTTTPDPSAMQFVYSNRRSRFVGSFIVVLVQ